MNKVHRFYSWIKQIPLFINQISSVVTVSQTVDDFKRRLGLSGHDVMNLRDALAAVKDGDEGMLEMMGMPSNAWNEVSYIFSKLIKSGFAA